MSVSYQLLKNERANGRSKVQAKISYVSEAYSSGLPVDKDQLGCPNILEDLLIEVSDPANPTIYKFDPSSSKIRIYEEDTGDFAEVSGNQTLDVTVIATGW